MNERVFILHENVPYEFGVVIGVFTSAEDAISHALGLDGEEYSVTSWIPAQNLEDMGKVEVWEIYRGEVTDHR